MLLKRKREIFLLASGHGLNDLIAGFFLGSFVNLHLSAAQTGIAITVYNILAFGGQYPVAIWLEKNKSPKIFLLFSYVLNLIAVIVFYFSPQLAIFFAGIASAIYHVAGGSVCAAENKATNIGFFAAPGVAGLIAGGYLAFIKLNILSGLIAATAVFLFIITNFKIGKSIEPKFQTKERKTNHSIDRHDIIMILLLIVISLRSVIWNIFQLIHENNYEWLIAIGLSAFLGKITGGWIADKIGHRVYALFSIAVATPLITFAKNEIILFCIGIGLLQSGIPATTSLLIKSLKGKTERGVSLSFGTAIITGAMFTLLSIQFSMNQWALITGILLIMVFILFLLKKAALETPFKLEEKL